MAKFSYLYQWTINAHAYGIKSGDTVFLHKAKGDILVRKDKLKYIGKYTLALTEKGASWVPVNNKNINPMIFEITIHAPTPKTIQADDFQHAYKILQYQARTVSDPFIRVTVKGAAGYEYFKGPLIQFL